MSYRSRTGAFVLAASLLATLGGMQAADRRPRDVMAADRIGVSVMFFGRNLAACTASDSSANVKL
jgi:hypothetical protein